MSQTRFWCVGPSPNATSKVLMGGCESKSRATAKVSAREDGESVANARIDDAQVDDAQVDDADNRSCHFEFDPNTGLSFFAGFGCGALHANVSNLSADASLAPYEEGFVVEQDGAKLGTITKILGEGGFGTVYSFELADGRRCAAKTIKKTLASNALKLEKSLAVECSIGFALGRSPLAASVIRMVVPDLPDLKTNAKGMMLLCDLIDCGDLQEAMGKDYRGKLYSDEGVAKWPLASITLQIYAGFHHVHERGIIHQARTKSTPRIRSWAYTHRCAGFQTRELIAPPRFCIAQYPQQQNLLHVRCVFVVRLKTRP